MLTAALLFIGVFASFPAAHAVEADQGDEECIVKDAAGACIAPAPSIDIEKATNGEQADAPPGPTIYVTDPVTWTYAVTNTGNVPLSNVTVTDDENDGALISCPSTALLPEETMECSASSTAWGDPSHTLHTNLGSVTAMFGDVIVGDEDMSHYTPALFCPIPKKSDSIVVNIYSADPTGDGGFMLGNGLNPDTVGPIAVSIPAGTYKVSLASYDDHSIKGGQYQDEEQYRLSLNGGTWVSSPTPDLPDADDLRWWTVDPALTLSGDVTSLLADHTGSDGIINSVHALCAVFDPIIVPAPRIDIEKATDGHDADEPTGPVLTVGDTVTWTYVITNTGNVELTNVVVTDDVIGEICTFDLLAVGATQTCTKTGTAELGQYANLGTVSGTHGDVKVTDKDPSHYTGLEAPAPSIDIEKATDGHDADEPTGPVLTVGDTVTWTYVITNTGNVELTNVVVTDDVIGEICTFDLLAVGATQTCTKTGTAELGQYANLGTVSGTHGDVKVTDKDPSHYTGLQVLGTAQLGDTVWLDKNKNGKQDSGEPGINGAKVVLKDASGTVIATATTAKGPWDGWYKFVGLDAGKYTAVLDLSSVSGTLTTAGAFTVDLVEGEEYLDADFGLYEEEELPKTGLDSDGLTLLAIGLLLLGALAVLSSRKRRGEER